MTHQGGTGRHHQAGVTLIEMMIVLVVIGVATGAATLGLGALARDDAAEQAARRMATAISLGVDAALITGVSQSVVWDAQGYGVGTGARQVLDPAVVLARADGMAGPAVLSAGADGAPVVFVLDGRAGPWHVAFDGLSVQAAAGPAP